MSPLRSVNPATEEVVEVFEVVDARRLDQLLAAAAAAFAGWRRSPHQERSAVLRRCAELLRRDRDRLAEVITTEMGKTLGEARAEVEKCAFCCEHYAEQAPAMLADVPMPSDSPRSLVRFDPLGPVLAIMPWNFPLWQVFRFAAPALAAGNVALLKHAPTTVRCALEIETLLLEAGLPRGGFTALLIEDSTAAEVIADPRVAAVTLTGSERAGASVAATAGRNLKHTVLELGGSDAFIVLADADVAAAAETAARSRFQNAGQSCIAAKRFIVHEAVAAEFEERLVAHAREVVVGDPRDDATTMGPLARADLRENLERQLDQTVAAGARLAVGGGRPHPRGWFAQPSVVVDCSPEMTAFREETFGPLAAVMRVRDEAQAIAVANASSFGLGGNLWTGDVERGAALARDLQTGGVFVNGMTHSDPRLPFGGIKRSGHGRELGPFGLHEFCNIKTVWLPG